MDRIRHASLLLLAALAGAPLLAQEKAWLIDSNLDRLFQVDLLTGAATSIAATNNNGLGTPAGLAWVEGTNRLWTIDLDDGQVGTVDVATGVFAPAFNATPGAGWQAIAWDAFTQRFYAANQNGSNYVIDPVAMSTTLLGSAGAGFTLITALDTDANGDVWGIDFGTGNLGRMNKTTGAMTLVSTVTPTGMQGMAFDSIGRLYANNTTTDSLYAINAATGAATLIGANGAGVQFTKGLEIARQQVSAYLLDDASDTLFWVDVGTGAATPIGPTANANLTIPAGLAWRQDTGTLWTIDLSGGEIGTLNRQTGAFTPTFTANPTSGWQAIVWDHTTQRFFAANQNSNNYVIDPATSTTTLLGPAGTGYALITAMDVDQGGNIWAVDFSTGNLGRMSKSTGAVTTVTTTQVNLQGLSFDLTGQLYGSSTATDSLYLINTGNGVATLVGAHGAGVTFAKGFQVIRPETSAMLVDSDLDRLFSVNLATGAALAGPSTANHGLSTPAGLAWRNKTYELWTVDLSGGEVGTIHPATGEFTPIYGTGLSGWQGITWDAVTQNFFLANQDGRNFRLDPNTGTTTLLGPGGVSLVTAIENDFLGNILGIILSGSANLVRMDRSTGAMTLGPATAPAGMQGLSFAPNGRLYASNTTTDSLYVINPDTGATTLVGAHGAGVQFAKGFEIAGPDCSGTAFQSGTGCPDQTSTVMSMRAAGRACGGEVILVGANTGAPAYFMVIGFSNTNWGPFPLPLGLAPFGGGTCTAYTSHDLAFGPIPAAGNLGINLPNLPGLQFYCQGFVLGTGTNPLGVAAANLLSVTIGVKE